MNNTKKREDFIIFGTQYFRAPTPPRDEWEKDLLHLKDLGFNTVKIWAQWAWIEPARGKYEFADFDQFLTLCDKHGIKVVINTILECAPEWVYLAYPEARILDMSRQPKFESIYQAYQVGGFRPCWDHKEVSDLGLRCLDELVSRFDERECLLAWDVWNEPVQELCSCESTQKAFRTWLMARFKGLEEINKFIGRKYGSIDEIPVPYAEDNYPLVYLMTKFMHDRLAEQISWRAEVIRKLSNHKPVMTHGVGPGSSIYVRNTDDWKVVKTVDYFGSSLHQWNNIYSNPKRDQIWSRIPLCLDAMYACNPNYWISEVASGDSHYGFPTDSIIGQDVRFWTWSSLAHSAKAVLYWQFKPERLGPEAPGWGLILMDGSDTDRSAEAKEAANFSREWKDFLLEASPHHDPVGLLWDVDSAILSGLATLKIDRSLDLQRVTDWNLQEFGSNLYTAALRGAYQALINACYAPRILTGDDDWSDLKVIYLPFNIMITPQLAKKIKEFVERGGTAVSEGGLGTYDYRTWHNPVVPGEGLHEVFSLKEKEFTLVLDKTSELNIALGKTSLTGVGNAIFKRVVQPLKAQVLGHYSDDGSPAVFFHKYGNGQTYYIAAHPSIHFIRSTTGREKNSFISQLIAQVIQPVYSIKSKGYVTGRILQKGQEKILFVFNHSNIPIQAVIELKDFKSTKLTGIRGEKPQNIAGGKLRMHIEARDVTVFFVS